MFSKKILPLLILILMLSICTVSAEDNTTIKENFEDITNTSSEKTFEDIQIAIDEAQSSTTITLNGTYNGNGKEIIIDKDLTIEGKDNTILNANSNLEYLTFTPEILH